MISAATERAAAAQVMPEFHQVRAEDFSTARPFAAAICLFTTLGQVTAAGQSGLGLLNSVHAALVAGSPFALEVPQREPTLRGLKGMETFGAGESYTKVSRRFDAADGTLNERFTVVSPAETRVYDLRYRLFSQSELQALLQDAGFAVRTWFGNYAGKPLDGDDATMLAIAEAG